VSKYTPGDWYVETDERYGPGHAYIRTGEGRDGVHICEMNREVRHRLTPPSDIAADAALIAAAPDLLEALKFMTAYAALNDDGCIGEESELVDVMLDPDNPGNVGRTIDMARAAIAKAGGAK